MDPRSQVALGILGILKLYDTTILSQAPVDFINTACRWYASDPLSVCLCCAAVVNQSTGALLMHAFCYCIATCILALTQHET